MNSDSVDEGLGRRIGGLLVSRSLESTRALKRNMGMSKETILGEFREIMLELGLDLTDDSLKDTPRRVAKMFCEEVFYGLSYKNFPKCTTIENKMSYDEMVSQRCSVMSMCEHHFVPFMGIAHVAYIPKNKVIGLSKINRVVDFFSRRPQVQERLTAQIHIALSHILQTKDVAVVIQAEHLCVKLRGVKDELSYTTTSKMDGKFMAVPALREEFLALTRSRS